MRQREGFALITLLILLPLILSIFSLMCIWLKQTNISAHILLDCIESSAEQLTNFEQTQNFNAREAQLFLKSKLETIVSKHIKFLKFSRMIFTYEISNPIFEPGKPPYFIRSLVYNVKLLWSPDTNSSADGLSRHLKIDLKALERHFTCGVKALRQGDKNEWIYTIIAGKY